MLSPAEFIGSYAGIGEKKAKSPVWKLLLLGILAGFLIGMGGVASTVASHALESASAVRLASGLIFPFGLVMVILTGAELFTGNCLITISVLEKRVPLAGMVYNLVFVYIGNFIGSLLLAAACAFSGQMNYNNSVLAVSVIKTGVAKCSLTFGRATVLGILCNLLVCIGVMCALCGKDIIGRAVGAYLPVAFFVIAGFEHCIANMYYVPAALFAKSVPAYASLATEAGVDLGALSWSAFIGHNLIPVTIGNIIGGCAFAALIWAGHRTKASA